MQYNIHTAVSSKINVFICIFIIVAMQMRDRAIEIVYLVVSNKNVYMPEVDKSLDISIQLR